MKLSKLHLCESTSFLKYLTRKLPNTPWYVLKDLIYQGLAPLGKGQEGQWVWDDINLAWPDIGPLDKLSWTPKPVLMTFKLDMFDDATKKALMQRSGGAKPTNFEVPRDSERHATQAARLGSSELAFKEPVIMMQKFDGKYELFEGWHRTIQAFSKYGDGFKGMAYVTKKIRG